MKRILTLLLVTLVTLLITACTGITQDVTEGRNQGKEILRCFDEEDSEALKSLFCEEVRNSHDLDEEIAEAMELFEGETVSYNKKFNVAEGEMVKEGIKVDEHFEYIIDSIETKQERKYNIVTHSYLIYNKNPKCIGITYLKVIDEETGETVQIGEYVY